MMQAQRPNATRIGADVPVVISEPEPSLSAVIATKDSDRPITRFLLSCLKQPLGPDDEIIIVVDTVDGVDEFYKIQKTVLDFACKNKIQWQVWLHTEGTPRDKHDWGHAQMNRGVAVAGKDWIVTNDDDDIFAPGAFNTIRAEIKKLARPMPILFKYRHYSGWVCPVAKDVTKGRIGGHSIVLPNIPGKIGKYGPDYGGDFDFIKSTIDLWGGEFQWADAVIAWCRPGPRDWPERWL